MNIETKQSQAVARHMSLLTARRETARKELALALTRAAKEATDLAALILDGTHTASSGIEFGRSVTSCAHDLLRIETAINAARDLAARLEIE